MEVAHVGVVGSEENADVAREAGQNQGLRFEVGEQRTERGGEEAGVLGLEHEIVVVVGPQELGDRPAAHTRFEAMADDAREVGLPPAKVVVDVDARNPVAPSAALQGGETWRHRQGLLQ